MFIVSERYNNESSYGCDKDKGTEALRKIKKYGIIVFCALLIFSAVTSAQAESGVFDYDAGPQEKCRLAIAKFRLWVPSMEDSKINGVFIVTPGRNRDGRNAVNDKKYKELANKWGFAIMANFLHGTPTDKDTYQLDRSGNTAKLLVDTLEHFAKIAKCNELKAAPLFLFGTSAGGNVTAQFPGYYPKRTIGVVAYIPTVGPGMNATKKLKIPMLIAIGAKDKKSWVNFSDLVWEKYGKKSFWTYAKHKDLGHNGRPASALGLIYADAVLKQRLILDNARGVKDSFSKKLSTGWSGDLSTYEILEAKSSKVDQNSCWLPDEATAKAWKKHLSTSY